MAERKFSYVGADGWGVPADASDSTTLGGLTMGGNIDMNSAGKVVNCNAATVANDALVYGQSGASLAGLAITTNDLALSGGATITGLPTTPTSATEAVSKSYADLLASGLAPKTEVHCLKMVDDSLVTAPTLTSGDAGDAYVVAGTGGAWSTFAIGDIVEWDGSSWNLLTQNSGSEPPDGAKVIVTDTSAAGSFASHENEVATYSASGDSWSFATADGGEVRVIHNPDGDSVYEFLAYVYDSENDVWVLSNGAGQVNAGLGLTKDFNTINVGNGDGISVTADAIAVDLTSNAGLTLTGTSPNKTLGVLANTNAGILIDASGVAIDLATTNPGLQFDGSGDLQVLADTTAGLEVTSSGVGIDLAASNPGLQFSAGDLAVLPNTAAGIEVGASGVAVSLEADGAIVFDGSNGGLEINLETTNPTLDISSNELGVKYSTTTGGLDQDSDGLKVKVDTTTIQINGSGQLEAIGAADANAIINSYTASNAITKGDPVYFDSTSGQIDQGDASNDTKKWVRGIALANIAQSASGEIVSFGPAAGVLTGATPGTVYYLNTTSGLIAAAPPSGNIWVVSIGSAINATDLFVDIQYHNKKPA